MGDTFGMLSGMPWKETSRVTARKQFISRLLAGERMTDLCREYGISRKTGYKFKERFERLGQVGLRDDSRRPTRSPGRMAEAVRTEVLRIKSTHPTWGAKKVRDWLLGNKPSIVWPARSTIHTLFEREGLVKTRRRRRRVTPYEEPFSKVEAANDTWCCDYKGQFRLGNTHYCYPLTVTDQFSRYLLACEGFERIRSDDARAVFEVLFGNYGLPAVIRSDNGTPFASRGLLGLSRLSAWWLSLGIIPERIEPGHPQQNGCHERMHRTLKAEATRPAGANLLQQQERFDVFSHVYNHQRPHEALGGRCPKDVYQPSKKRLTAVKPLDYPLHDDVRTVSSCGHIRLLKRRNNASVFLSSALAGHRVGMREMEDGRWLLSFAVLDLGIVDTKTMQFSPLGKDTTTDN